MQLNQIALALVGFAFAAIAIFGIYENVKNSLLYTGRVTGFVASVGDGGDCSIRIGGSGLRNTGSDWGRFSTATLVYKVNGKEFSIAAEPRCIVKDLSVSPWQVNEEEMIYYIPWSPATAEDTQTVTLHLTSIVGALFGAIIALWLSIPPLFFKKR